MLTIRKSKDRGYADHGWLKTYHTFSFANYYDPQFQGYRDLFVINQDRVDANNGFSKHGHRDMEIITYVIEGQLSHNDSIGNGSVIKAGDVQRMSAGTGVVHSEENNSSSESVHLLQIWIKPDTLNLSPSYNQIYISPEQKINKLRLIASGNKNSPSPKDTLIIQQDVDLYATILEKDATISYNIDQERYAWIQVISGILKINEVELEAGDGAAIQQESVLTILSLQTSEFLLFDLC